MKTKSKPVEPTVVITLTKFGVSKTTILYRNQAEEKAGLELQARCASIIHLLSRAASGAVVQTPALPIELPGTPVNA